MKKIGRYTIRGLLGKGGMGKVYKVEMPVIGKIAALKLLDPNPLTVRLMGAEPINNLFVSEAITMANLRHPNIAEIWDFDEADGKPFYIMDYYFNNLGVMIGESYMTEQPSRIIKIDKAIHYIRQTLEGLASLHHAGIIHRDIKPYNILVTEQDTVKICDFGLSKLRGESFKGPSHLKVGSPWYAAPEQEENPDTVDFSADIYAVGIMLFRMLTGTLPMKNFKMPSQLNPDLNKDWDAFILKAIARKSRERFTSAKLMLQELEKLHTEWEAKKEKICALPFQTDQAKPAVGSSLSPAVGSSLRLEPTAANLRSHKVKVCPSDAQEVFALDDLYRPMCYVRNDFRPNHDGTVSDRATGLIWQQSGSEYPMTWHQARAYIAELNQKQFAGHQNWRLPTTDELISLLTETPHGEDFCMEPVFDPVQKWLWSCDRRSYMAAWYVSADMGFVSWQDFSGYYYVRGVRSLQGDRRHPFFSTSEEKRAKEYED